MKTKSFSDIIQAGIDKRNRQLAKNRGLIASIVAQNQAAGNPSGPICITDMIKRQPKIN